MTGFITVIYSAIPLKLAKHQWRDNGDSGGLLRNTNEIKIFQMRIIFNCKFVSYDVLHRILKRNW